MNTLINPSTLNLQPLHDAVWRRSISDVERLLDAGADLTAVDQAGQSPLHYACWAVRDDHNFHRSPARATRIVELLLLAGADVEMRDALGLLPSARCEGAMPEALRIAVREAAARNAFWVPEDTRGETVFRRHNGGNPWGPHSRRYVDDNEDEEEATA